MEPLLSTTFSQSELDSSCESKVDNIKNDTYSIEDATKMEETKFFSPMQASTDIEDCTPAPTKTKYSFLPAFTRLSTNDDLCTPNRIRTTKMPNLSSIKKKIPLLRLKKLKIETKVLNNKKAKKNKSRSCTKATRLENVMEVSDDKQESPAEKIMSLTLKKARGIWTTINNEESKNSSGLKELFINLIPLENTDLIDQCTKMQLSQHSLNSFKTKSDDRTSAHNLNLLSLCKPCRVNLIRADLYELLQQFREEASKKRKSTANSRNIKKKSKTPKLKASKCLSPSLQNCKNNKDQIKRRSSRVVNLKALPMYDDNSRESTPLRKSKRLSLDQLAERSFAIDVNLKNLSSSEKSKAGYLNISNIDAENGRRSTLTLDDFVTDINLLKSFAVDPSDTRNLGNDTFIKDEDSIEDDNNISDAVNSNLDISIISLNTTEETSPESIIEIEDSTSTSISNSTFNIEGIKPLNNNTPKSAFRSKDGHTNHSKRVTFNDVSVIILNGTNGMYISPVPTHFPVEENETLECRSPQKFIKRGTVGHSPLPAKRKPITRVSVQGPDSKKKSSVKKIPNFKKLHEKLYRNIPNLEEYVAQKSNRAKMLLSGRKVSSGNMSNIVEKPKRQLRFSNSPKTNVLKVDNNEKQGFTRYGFKKRQQNEFTKEEQKKLLATKEKPLQRLVDKNKVEIKGVRTNRRFELLMKLRNQK